MPDSPTNHHHYRYAGSTNSSELASPETATTARLCWICQGAAATGDGDDEVLVDCVCRCRGSLGAVHQRCIDQWVLHQGKTHCSSCGSSYHSVTAVPKDVLLHSSTLSRPIDYDVPPSVSAIFLWMLGRLMPQGWWNGESKRRRERNAKVAQLVESSLLSSHAADVELHASEQLLALLLPHTTVGKLWYVFHHLLRPWLRRCLWFILLFVWHNIALPLLYGVAYYSHDHLGTFLWAPQSSSSGRSGEAPTTDEVLDSPPTSDRLMLQCNAFLVGVVLTIVFRFTCSGWKHWQEFIRAGSEPMATSAPRERHNEVLEEVEGLPRRADATVAPGDGSSGSDFGDTSNFTVVEFLQNMLSDAMFRCCGWSGACAPFLRQELAEAQILLPVAWVLGLHGSLEILSVTAVVASLVLRVRHPLKEVRRPTARLEETVARRAEATPLDTVVWFVTYLCDMLAFSVLLPTLGGYVLHYSLGRRLVLLPDRVARAVDWTIASSGEMTNATMTAAAAVPEVMLAVSRHAVDLVVNSASSSHLSSASASVTDILFSFPSWVASVFTSPWGLWWEYNDLPWFSDVLLHWLVGTMCLMTLLRYESSVVVPLFQPGVDLFFIRSIDVSDESLGDREDDFAWKFILSQVFDADPLRVLIDYIRVGVLESLALLGFVCFPVRGAFALAACWYGDRAVPAQLTPLSVRHLWDDTALNGPSWTTWMGSGLSLFGSKAVVAAAEVVLSVSAAEGSATATASPDLTARAANAHPALLSGSSGSSAGEASVFSWWSLILNVVAFGTIVSCLMNYPIQRYQLTCLLPTARWLARLVRLEDFLFDPSRLEMVDNFLAMPVVDDGGDVELVMPAVPDERRFVRRERWYTDENRPKLLRIRLAIFSFGFYVVSTICWWGLPILVAAALLPFCTSTLEFVRYSLLLSCFVVHPRLFVISHLRFLAVLAALSLAWLFQLVQVVSSWYALVGLDLLVLHTFEYKHYAVRRVAKMHREGAVSSSSEEEGKRAAEPFPMPSDATEGSVLQ